MTDAERQKLFEDNKAIKAEIQAAEPLDISICRVGDRYKSFYTIQGERKLVLGVAKHMIERETCTPHYEHMLMCFNSFKELSDGRLEICLSKSHYAGD